MQTTSGECGDGYMIKVVAGTAARLGIKPGDRVEHPLFRQQ